MISLLIILSILSILLTVISVSATYIAWRAVMAFLASEAQKENYHSYIRVMLDRIQDSSEIFRVSVVKRMGADIPEVKELNTLLKDLETNMVSFRSNLVQFLED